MGSAFVNYYRKKDEKDEYIPKVALIIRCCLVEHHSRLLGWVRSSIRPWASRWIAFHEVWFRLSWPNRSSSLQQPYSFTSIPPQVVSYWFPRHQASHRAYCQWFYMTSTFRRNTVKGDSKYFIREIKNLYVLGQTYPVTEVPGPHSRKITNTIKYRLQIIAFKLLKKSPGERLKISRLMKYFPDQNELQMRQRLKVGVFYPMTVDNFDISLLRSLWSITGEGPIRDSGDLNLQCQFLLMRKCLKWLTRSKSS